MITHQSTAFAHAILKPETREELQRRLRYEYSNPRTQPRTGRSQDQPPLAGSEAAYSGSYISPMTREQSGRSAFFAPSTAATSPSASTTAGAGWLETLKDPEALREACKDPQVRKSAGISLAAAALLCACWMFWPESEETAEHFAAAAEIVEPASEPMRAPAEESAPLADGIASAPQAARLTTDAKTYSAVTPAPLKLEPAQAALTAKPQVTVERTQVTIFVESPNRVAIEVDDDRNQDINKLTLPLAPGFHRVRISKPGYETYDREVEVLRTAKQVLPTVRLEKKAPVAPPIQVISQPAGATILAKGKPTGFVTPAVLPPYFSMEEISVQLEGYEIESRESERKEGVEVLSFYLTQLPPERTTLNDYGLELTPAQRDSVASVLHKLLDDNWNATPEEAAWNAKHQVAAWDEFTNYDPRLYHAHGLLLWHHGRIEEAKARLSEAENRERNRPSQQVPYYPLSRDKIRLETATGEEELAAEDLVDLMADTARTLENHPQAGLYEAQQNADFAGRLLGYLEGPARVRLSGAVNPRVIGANIESRLPNDNLKQTFRAARNAVRDQYQQELAQAQAQQKAHDDREAALQKSGELGQTSIRARDNRVTGRHQRSDHNAQTVTPFRIPTGPRVFATERGVVAAAFGPVGHYHFPNLLFTSGPAVSKSIFNNRTTNLNRYLRKEVKEKLPDIEWRRPQALTTYMPQELERKRRDLLESLPAPSDI